MSDDHYIRIISQEYNISETLNSETGISYLNYALISTCLVGVGCISYWGYTWGKNKFRSYLMSRVKDELDRRMKEEDEKQVFKPLRKTKSAMISFDHGGKQHKAFVPYNRRKASTMIGKTVYLIKDENGDEVRENITQKPGIPYIVSAQDLGGKSIEVVDNEGQVLHRYIDDQIPDCF
jgi:hypothetical protein